MSGTGTRFGNLNEWNRLWYWKSEARRGQDREVYCEEHRVCNPGDIRNWLAVSMRGWVASELE
jgi:hypothetical protein